MGSFVRVAHSCQFYSPKIKKKLPYAACPSPAIFFCSFCFVFWQRYHHAYVIYAPLPGVSIVNQFEVWQGSPMPAFVDRHNKKATHSKEQAWRQNKQNVLLLRSTRCKIGGCLQTQATLSSRSPYLAGSSLVAHVHWISSCVSLSSRG